MPAKPGVNAVTFRSHHTDVAIWPACQCMAWVKDSPMKDATFPSGWALQELDFTDEMLANSKSWICCQRWRRKHMTGPCTQQTDFKLKLHRCNNLITNSVVSHLDQPSVRPGKFINGYGSSQNRGSARKACEYSRCGFRSNPYQGVECKLKPYIADPIKRISSIHLQYCGLSVIHTARKRSTCVLIHWFLIYCIIADTLSVIHWWTH